MIHVSYITVYCKADRTAILKKRTVENYASIGVLQCRLIDVLSRSFPCPLERTKQPFEDTSLSVTGEELSQNTDGRSKPTYSGHTSGRAATRDDMVATTYDNNKKGSGTNLMVLWNDKEQK